MDDQQHKHLSVRAFLEESTLLLGKSISDFSPEEESSSFVKLHHDAVIKTLTLKKDPCSKDDESATPNPMGVVKVANSVNQVCKRKRNGIEVESTSEKEVECTPRYSRMSSTLIGSSILKDTVETESVCRAHIAQTRKSSRLLSNAQKLKIPLLNGKTTQHFRMKRGSEKGKRIATRNNYDHFVSARTRTQIRKSLLKVPEVGMLVTVKFEGNERYNGTITRVRAKRRQQPTNVTTYKIQIHYEDNVIEDTTYPDPDISLIRSNAAT